MLSAAWTTQDGLVTHLKDGLACNAGDLAESAIVGYYDTGSLTDLILAESVWHALGIALDLDPAEAECTEGSLNGSEDLVIGLGSNQTVKGESCDRVR